MKFIVENWYLILIALTSGGLLIWPLIQENKAGLTTTMAVQLINRERAVLIDVSDSDEFLAAHAQGAKNIPLADLKTKLIGLIKKKDTVIIFMCPVGKRSARAALIARKMGYSAAQNLIGGLGAWRNAHLPIYST